MRIVVLQPGYLPWLGFFDQMARCDRFVVYDDVLYDKNGWRNRNRVKTNAGVQWVTVPVLLGEHAQQPLIKDVRIDNRSRWGKKHLETIRQAYGRAPHVEPLFGRLSDVLTAPWEYLVDLDLAVVGVLREALGLETPMVRSSELGIEGERVERLVALCRHFGADAYLSGNAAQSYLDEDAFDRAGMKVYWQDYEHPVYPQFHGEFVPYLSVVDLLFQCGPDSLALLRRPDPAFIPVASPRP